MKKLEGNVLLEGEINLPNYEDSNILLQVHFILYILRIDSKKSE